MDNNDKKFCLCVLEYQYIYVIFPPISMKYNKELVDNYIFRLLKPFC